MLLIPIRASCKLENQVLPVSEVDATGSPTMPEAKILYVVFFYEIHSHVFHVVIIAQQRLRLGHAVFGDGKRTADLTFGV